MTDCSNIECTNLGKDTYVRKISNLKLIDKSFRESTGVQCIEERNGIYIVSVLVTGVNDPYCKRNITNEFKKYFGLTHKECFIDKICIDTGKINYIACGDICPEQQKEILIQYATVCGKLKDPSTKKVCIDTDPCDDDFYKLPLFKKNCKDSIVDCEPCNKDCKDDSIVDCEPCKKKLKELECELITCKEKHINKKMCLDPCRSKTCYQVYDKCSGITTSYIQEDPCKTTFIEYEPKIELCKYEPCYEPKVWNPICKEPCKKRRRRKIRNKSCSEAICEKILENKCLDPCELRKHRREKRRQRRNKCVKPCVRKRNMLLFPLYPIRGAYVYPLLPNC